MTMLRRTGALLVAALPATASAASWTRGTGAVSVTVDSGTFAYSVALSDSLQDDAIADAATCGGFEGGGIEFRCDGVLYTHGGTASAGTALKLAAAPAESTGADRLGSFDSISASFEGGSSAACALFAEIRYYSTTESFVFAADFAPQPVPRVNSTELFTDGTDCPRCPQGSGKKCNGYCVEDMPGLPHLAAGRRGLGVRVLQLRRQLARRQLARRPALDVERRHGSWAAAALPGRKLRVPPTSDGSVAPHARQGNDWQPGR
jgi:hypothetical protein